MFFDIHLYNKLNGISLMNIQKSRFALAIGAVAMTLITACSSDDKKETTDIRWTSYGVPHIKAENYTDLGEGLGYVMAKDRYCNVVKGVATSKGETAKYLGAGADNRHVNSDFAYLHLGAYQQAKDTFAQLDSRMQQLMKGFAAGFNYAIKKNKHYAGDCQIDIASIDHLDIHALNLSINYWSFAAEYIQQIGAAEPQALGAKPKKLEQIIKNDMQKSIAERSKGSNGWAIGRDLSSSGKGMVLSNTHLQHRDEFLWYEAHLTIPNEIDVYGGFLPGFMTPALGFNDSFSWTHTWTNAITGSVYMLTPSDLRDLHYVYDNIERALSAHEYQIQVKGSDGSLTEQSRTLYKSHHGPIFEFDVEGRMLAVKDAPSLAANKSDFWLKLALSKSVNDAVNLIEQGYRTGSQNIIMADQEGNTFYADLAEVPKLNEQAWQIIAQVPELVEHGGKLLDGSNSLFEWQSVAPLDEIPQRYSNSYVQNANESPWLVNMDEPLVDYSPMYGDFEYKQYPRTLLSLKLLEELKERAEKVELSDLHYAMTDKRIYLAELQVDDLVDRCQRYPEYPLGEDVIQLSEACDVLDNWDRKANLGSVGTHLFREYAVLSQVLQYFRGCDGPCWRQPFDANTPLTTPSGLPEVIDPSNDIYLEALANAVLLMGHADIALDAKLEQYQQLVKGSQSYPIAGGIGDFTGSYSTVNVNVTDMDQHFSYSGLNANGYDIESGDGYVYLLEFTDTGLNAQSVLLYSQSNNPNSPHYFDQAPLIDTQYKTVKFTEKSIEEDENYSVEKLEIK